jgi:FkbM family methyltransferase
MKCNNIDDLIENRNGWWWPKTDRVCWKTMCKFPNIPQDIMKYVDSKNVVVQAGGNAGYYVKQYAEKFKTVYTFEPDALNFHCLNRNVTSSNVFKFQSCLGEIHKTVGFNVNESNRGASHINGEGAIPTLRIDDLGLIECNLIHLDIEGYEYFALLGAIETIKRCSPIITIEVWVEMKDRFVENSNDLSFKLLNSLGYEQIDVINEHDIVFKRIK